MRTFELILILLTAADGISRVALTHRRPLWAGITPLLAFLFAITHIAGEGARWQMIPVYIAVATTFIGALRRAFTTGDLLDTPGRYARQGGCVVIALALLALVAGTALPVFELPPPNGDYAVGQQDITFADSTSIRVYYPTDHPTGDRSVWSEQEGDDHTRYLSRRYGMPAALLGHLSAIPTHAYADATLSTELPRYRVLIAQPETSRPSTSTLGLAQDLASHGFVVLCSLDRSTTDTTSSGFDPESLSEHLESLDPDGPGGWLADRLDTARIGVYGFGTAAQAVIEACSSGTFRAGAVIGSEARSTDPVVPFLYLRPEAVEDAPLTDVKTTTYVISIRGTLMDNFSDDAYVSPLMPTLGAFGSIDPDRATHITRTYLNAFFNKHLTRGTVEPVLDAPHPDYPEVSLQIHDADNDEE